MTITDIEDTIEDNLFQFVMECLDEDFGNVVSNMKLLY